MEILRSHAELMTGNILVDLSNTSSFIFTEFSDLNWAGFYLLEGDTLFLGPFNGKPACTHIKLGKGVCGSSALSQKPLLVPDVDQFPEHIRCDTGSRSELVIPMILPNTPHCIGVLDLDSPSLNRFDQSHTELFEKIVLQLILAQKNQENLKAWIRLSSGG